MCFLNIFPLAGFLFIVLIIILKVMTLQRRGIMVRASRRKMDFTVFLLYPVFLLLLFLWLAALVVKTFQIPFFPEFNLLIRHQIVSSWLEAAGAGLIVLSIVVMVITMLHFQSSFRFGMDKKNQGKLITTGIFLHSRNPFFVSVDLFFIGQAMIFPGILFITMALLAMPGIHLFIMKEEKFLIAYYKKDYLDYKSRVRRYF